jgi:hypothetical protein
MGCYGAYPPIDPLLPYSVSNLMLMQIFYAAQTVLAHAVGNVAHGLANNSMTTAKRAALLPDNPEYQARYVSSRF